MLSTVLLRRESQHSLFIKECPANSHLQEGRQAKSDRIFETGYFKMTIPAELQRKIDLLYLLTRKEFTLKYKRTILGIFWSLLNPILLAVVFAIAFKIFMRFKIENYLFFLLSALFPWSWFQASLIISARSLLDNVSLIKKVIFPRPYLVCSVILAQTVHFLSTFPILIFCSYFYMDGPTLAWLVGIPLLLTTQFLLTFGMTLVVSIANTFFRDIEYLIGVGLNLLFWGTPIVYPMQSVPEKFQFLFLLNPMTSLMHSWRELFLYNQIHLDKIFFAFFGSLLLFWGGLAIFKKLEKRLDEVL